MQDATQLDAAIVAEVLIGERNGSVASGNVAAAVRSGSAETRLCARHADADVA